VSRKEVLGARAGGWALRTQKGVSPTTTRARVFDRHRGKPTRPALAVLNPAVQDLMVAQVQGPDGETNQILRVDKWQKQ
jgi:hypothetical protein